MKSKHAKSRVAASIAAIALTTQVFAADDLLKPAPTPAPSAGPTVSAAQQFCGEPSGKAEELINRYSNQKGLTEIYKSIDYVAYADDPKNPAVVYTFTLKGQAAHPAAVCRRQVKEGDAIVIKMEIVCDGAQEGCKTLRNDFNVLTAQMQTEVDNRIKAGGK